MRWLGLLVVAGMLSGCTAQRLSDLVQALNDRNVSQCLFVHTAFQPIGNAYLYARTGSMDCEALWESHRQTTRP